MHMTFRNARELITYHATKNFEKTEVHLHTHNVY